jgi:hypothetical protein
MNLDGRPFREWLALCSGQRELCTPLVRHSTPIRHLGKNRGPDFDTFSPGTEYHFARNSTKMKTISTQVFDEFTAHNLRGFPRKSTVKKYLAPDQDSPSIQRRIRVDP